jgi:hypothetical protein
VKLRMRTAGAVALSALAACSMPTDNELPPPLPLPASTAVWADLGRECAPDAPVWTVSAAALDSTPVLFRDTNFAWADIARRAPGGWGGYFVDRGMGTAYFVDPSQREAANAFFRSEGIHIPSAQVAKQGRWDFAQMYDWYRYLRRHVWVPGTSFSDIQEARNRLEYGAIDEPTRVRMEEVLAALEIPCFLVAIEIRPYAIAAGGS